jgi:hypothetical protein
LWGNIATKEKKSERPKIRRSIMHSIRKTHWGDRDSGEKGVMRRSGYDLKISGDSRDSIQTWKRLSQGIITFVGDMSKSG